MELLLKICNFIIGCVGALYCYQIIYVVLGLFFTKRFKKAKRLHKYAILVCARNEERVIGNLLDSIEKQDYPREKITVFVVADNCNDNTANIAREHGAVVYEKKDTQNCTKGYALQFLFKKIQQDYGINSFEAYMVFDADNLLKCDYVSRMNDAFDSGEKIVTSYRNTKNFDSGFIAAGYAFHWLRTCRFTSRARSFLGISTWVQGCGFLFANELVLSGWEFTSLTEDRAFSISAIIKGYRISYQNDAEFYDEQPYDMKIVMRQRIRWAKEHLQAFAQYWTKLAKGVFVQKGFIKKWNCYDMLVTMMPYSVLSIPLKLLRYIFTLVILLTAASVFPQCLLAVPKFVEIFIFEHIGVIPMALMLFVLEYKRLAKIRWYKALFYAVMFPLFGIIGDIATWVALFRKVTWEPIPHGENVCIRELEDKISALREAEKEKV